MPSVPVMTAWRYCRPSCSWSTVGAVRFVPTFARPSPFLSGRGCGFATSSLSLLPGNRRRLPLPTVSLAWTVWCRVSATLAMATKICHRRRQRQRRCLSTRRRLQLPTTHTRHMLPSQPHVAEPASHTDRARSQPLPHTAMPVDRHVSFMLHF